MTHYSIKTIINRSLIYVAFIAATSIAMFMNAMTFLG